MRFLEKQYSILDPIGIKLLPATIDVNQWIQSGIKFIFVVIDLENNNKLIHFSGRSSSKLNDMNLSFNDLYKQIIDLNEDKFNVLISLYSRVEGESILNILNNEKHCRYDFLYESNGHLIYHHQFVEFLKLEMGFNETESVELRKSWNKKIKADREKITSNKNYTLLKNLMPFDSVFQKCINI